MTQPASTPVPTPPIPTPPVPTTPPRLRQIALGFGLGCLVFAVLRAAEGLFLHTPCEGRTLWALLAPLILGPGGIAYATTNVGKGNGQAALGVGLAIASLFPALAFGVRDIGMLRTQGCAGGYVVFSTPGGGKLPQLTLKPGEQTTLEVRPGGFNVAGSANKPIALSVVQSDIASGAGVLQAHFDKTQILPGQSAPLTLKVSPKAPEQQYTLTVLAAQGERQADGQLTVTVR